MSVEGFDLAFEHADPILLSSATSVLVPRLPVLVALKMIAWLDSVGGERERDLADLAHVFDRYLEPTDDRRYADDVYERGLTYDQTGPYVLGCELAAIASPRHRAHVVRFLDRVSDTNHPPFHTMFGLGPSRWRGDQEDPEAELSSRLDAFRLGFGP